MNKKIPLHFVLKGFCVGSSMDPLIKPTAELEIHVKTNDTYGIGDIVVFIQRSMYVAHRIISIGQNKKTPYFTLKGDNNTKIDGIFTSKQIFGKVEKIIQNKHIIDLKQRKHIVLKYFFALYSLCNKHQAIAHISKFLRSSKTLKLIFRRMVWA
jgi:signal peptidase I